jgi:hypothetical protein
MKLPMKLAPIFLLSSLLTLSGCWQDEKVVRVKPDGSGVVTQTVIISSALLEMTGSGKPGASGPDEIDEAKLKTEALEMGEGVTFVSAEKVKTAMGRGFKATFAFSDISKLKLGTKPPVEGPTAGNAPDRSEGAKKPPYTFQFKKGSPATLTIAVSQDEPDAKKSSEPAASSEKADPSMQEAMLPMIAQMFKDMRMTLALEFVGQITKANAQYREGNRVTLFDVDFNKIISDPAQLKAFSKVSNVDSKEGKEFLKTVPGLKVESGRSIEITFK